jgi:very-short-patch-repair endonuclease
MSLPEVLLWRELRLRPGGFKFRRQQPAGHYIVDFYCAGARLAIEVDGEAHDRGDRQQQDAARDASLKADGVSVLRISAVEVLRDVEVVVSMIVAHISALPLHHPSGGPPPRTGED